MNESIEDDEKCVRHNYDSEKNVTKQHGYRQRICSREVLRYERRKETKCKDVGNNPAESNPCTQEKKEWEVTCALCEAERI